MPSPTQPAAGSTSVHLPPHPVLGGYYSDPAERQTFVNNLFDDSSRHYDRITALMSFGTGGAYRRSVLKRIGVKPGSRVLDVACGTGQVSAAAVQLVGQSGSVVGVDPSEGMRRVAQRVRGIKTLAGTAEHLPVDDQSVDFVLMGYALRHVSDLVAAFAEMRRVLRPGGTIAILEITPPDGAVARFLLKLYLKGIVPPLSLLVTASPAAMRLMSYYWQSIEACVCPDAIVSAMRTAGFVDPARHRTLGIFNEYVARAPE